MENMENRDGALVNQGDNQEGAPVETTGDQGSVDPRRGSSLDDIQVFGYSGRLGRPEPGEGLGRPNPLNPMDQIGPNPATDREHQIVSDDDTKLFGVAAKMGEMRKRVIEEKMRLAELEEAMERMERIMREPPVFPGGISPYAGASTGSPCSYFLGQQQEQQHRQYSSTPYSYFLGQQQQQQCTSAPLGAGTTRAGMRPDNNPDGQWNASRGQLPPSYGASYPGHSAFQNSAPFAPTFGHPHVPGFPPGDPYGLGMPWGYGPVPVPDGFQQDCHTTVTPDDTLNRRMTPVLVNQQSAVTLENLLIFLQSELEDRRTLPALPKTSSKILFYCDNHGRNKSHTTKTCRGRGTIAPNSQPTTTGVKVGATAKTETAATNPGAAAVAQADSKTKHRHLCPNCGYNSDHKPENCFTKHWVCKRCNRKGHLRQVCPDVQEFARVGQPSAKNEETPDGETRET